MAITKCTLMMERAHTLLFSQIAYHLGGIRLAKAQLLLRGNNISCQMVVLIAYHTVTLDREHDMATNPPSGDGRRNGMVKGRSQTKTPSGHYVKRDTSTGRFMDVKTSDKKPFKGVRKEK